MECLIYALIDPQTGEPRYVGKSQRGLQRPREHGFLAVLARDRNFHKVNWLKRLRRLGLQYGTVVLWASPSPSGLADAERFWIANLRSRGFRLLNLTDGGDGGLRRPRSQVSRQRMSLAARKERSSEQGRVRLARIQTERWNNPEFRARMGLKPIVAIDLQRGNVVRYESIGDAVRAGFSRSSISVRINELVTSPYKGFFWKAAT
jgi:hypothetical protein